MLDVWQSNQELETIKKKPEKRVIQLVERKRRLKNPTLNKKEEEDLLKVLQSSMQLESRLNLK